MQEAQLRRLRALGIPGELGGTFPSVPQYSGPLFQLVCVLSIKEAGAETEIRVPEEDVAGVLHSIAGVGFCYFEGRRTLGSQGMAHGCTLEGRRHSWGEGNVRRDPCTRGLGAISQILSGGSPESRRSLGMGAGTEVGTGG